MSIVRFVSIKITGCTFPRSLPGTSQKEGSSARETVLAARCYHLGPSLGAALGYCHIRELVCTVDEIFAAHLPVTGTRYYMLLYMIRSTTEL